MRYLLVFIVFVSCRTANTAFDMEPLCLQEAVNKIMEEPAKNPRNEIKQGFFNGENIYMYIEKRGVTEFVIILNADCEYICEIGGVIGTANCPDGLFESLKYMESLWIDPR